MAEDNTPLRTVWVACQRTAHKNALSTVPPSGTQGKHPAASQRHKFQASRAARAKRMCEKKGLSCLRNALIGRAEGDMQQALLLNTQKILSAYEVQSGRGKKKEREKEWRGWVPGLVRVGSVLLNAALL